MKRFSGLFWFTIFAGGFSSVLLTWAALAFLQVRSTAMIARCGHGGGCASAESLRHLFREAYAAQSGGTILLFGLAYCIGRRFLRPAAAKDASQ